MTRCEHCGKRLINPISRWFTYGLYHLRCVRKKNGWTKLSYKK